MDLLIGPVYKSGARLLARYARDHQIVCVNPLSQDGDLVVDNPWHYLFGPRLGYAGPGGRAVCARHFRDWPARYSVAGRKQGQHRFRQCL
ncbi:hypothetical protein ACFQT0_14535 [Hymenobacter humi]|uniref:Uncharacterized protein n=1 Tax=Hymenobacter humi TaxID=1411620 RepID=A0ABW2U4P4_9BACT